MSVKNFVKHWNLTIGSISSTISLIGIRSDLTGWSESLSEWSEFLSQYPKTMGFLLGVGVTLLLTSLVRIGREPYLKLWHLLHYILMVHIRRLAPITRVWQTGASKTYSKLETLFVRSGQRKSVQIPMIIGESEHVALVFIVPSGNILSFRIMGNTLDRSQYKQINSSSGVRYEVKIADYLHAPMLEFTLHKKVDQEVLLNIDEEELTSAYGP